MSPQHKKVPTPEHQRRIEKARERLDAARAELEAAEAGLLKATVDAMKAGASHREAAVVAGVSDRTTHRWGKANGWPTAEQVAAREAARPPKTADLLDGFRKMAEERDPT